MKNGNLQDQLLNALGERKAEQCQAEINAVLRKYGYMLIFHEERVNGQTTRAGFKFSERPVGIELPPGMELPPGVELRQAEPVAAETPPKESGDGQPNGS